jgi:hypothetical protein
MYCSYCGIICVITFTVHNMDPVDLIPERRAKSWKREHEERCRRHQNSNDLKKCRDPGYGPDQSVLLEVKDSSTDLIKDAVRVEKMEMSASDKLLYSSGDSSVESESASALRTTTENSTTEYESTNKAPAESEIINNLRTIEGILSDGTRSEIIFPLVQTAEGLDVDTENNLHKDYLEKEEREDSVERSGVHMDCKGDSVMPGHICEGLSLFDNVEGSEKSHTILQQFETEMPEITPEKCSEISGETELGSSELLKVKSSPLEVSAELSELTMMKGTDLVHLEEALTRREAVNNMPLEFPEGVPTRPADVKPETLEDITLRFQDNMKDATVERISHGESEFKDVLQGHLGNISTVHAEDVNSEESVQKADVFLDTGEELGKCGKRGDLAGSDALELEIINFSEVTILNNINFEIVDSLVCSQDIEHGNSSSIEGSNLSSFETPGNVAEKLEEKETAGVKRGKNLFVELCHEEHFVKPLEFVDKTEHSVCLVASTSSVSSLQAREQSASESLEGPGTCGENNKFVSDCSVGNVAVECKATDKDSETIEVTGLSKSENPVSELNEGNSKHLMDNPALEIVGDMFHECAQLDRLSADSKYCLGIDIVQDHTLPSETAFLQPSAMASEDKVNNYSWVNTVVLLALEPTQSPIQWVAGALSPVVKQLRCEVDHLPPKNICIYPLPHMPSGTTLPFYFLMLSRYHDSHCYA